MTGNLAGLARRIAMAAARGIVRAVGDGTDLQTLRIGLMEDEAKDGVERVQEYGFTSHPLPGADCVAIFIGGNRDHGAVVATDDRRHRPGGLAAGDVAIYDNRGHQVHLSAGGVEITAPGLVTITAPIVEINGDVSITGAATLAGNLVADGVSLRDHVHPENDSGGPTDPPVQA